MKNLRVSLFIFIFFASNSFLFSQRIYDYCWERYGLEFTSSHIMNEMSDIEYWDVDDDSMDFWVEAERIEFKDIKSPEALLNAKNAAQMLGDSLGYDKNRNGGKLELVPEGYYVILKDAGDKSYFAVIIDRPKQVLYTVLVEDMLGRKSLMLQVINSLRFKP